MVKHMRLRRSQAFSDKGFTIVELAIVLVIVGILISLGISMIGPLSKRAKVSETRGVVDAGAESLTGYAATNRRLPTTVQFAAALQKASDAWGNTLYYIVDGSLTGTADAICGRRSTYITVRNCRNAACTIYADVQNVAFIIGSFGSNFNNQTAATQTVTAAATINIYDAGLAVDGHAGDLGGARTEPYDDIIKWVTVEELRTKTGCAGHQLRVVNNELPAGNVTNTYGAAVYGDGGVPYSSGGSYRWCLQTTTGVLAADLPGFTAAPGAVSTNCQGLAEASWGQADNLQISKTAGASSAGSYNVTVYTRDNADTAGGNDNIAYRAFVITISP